MKDTILDRFFNWKPIKAFGESKAFYPTMAVICLVILAMCSTVEPIW